MESYYNEAFDKSRGEILRLRCVTCKPEETRHEVKASLDCNGGSDKGMNSYDQVDIHQIVQCMGCLEVSFRQTSSNSEDVDHDVDGTVTATVTERLYPPRGATRTAEALNDWHLPSKVQAIYAETLNALNARLPVLAGAGLRALVEAVCNERSAEGKVLQAQIDDLVRKQILTRTGAAILHQIRHLGNNAVHEIKPHTGVQLSLAMDVIEHLLREVYILPAEAAAQFPQPSKPPVIGTPDA